MGLALAAELNGYPGPKHVLELSRELQLSESQRGQMQRLFDDMQREAIALGEKLIAQEAALDRSFADRTISEVTLSEATNAIGRTQAALRAAHLKYHLVTVAILTPQQIHRYTELRGYSGGNGQHRRQH
jgi:Spy/CpxP family protein refolding chaperone